MNKDEVQKHLQSLGMKKPYKAQWDQQDGRGVILFDTRGDCAIIDGVLHGTKVILSDRLITVWTSKTKKAMAFCRGRGLRLRVMTGECEFSLPASAGDEFLTLWGAKVKRGMSDERKAELATRLQKARGMRKTLSGSTQTPYETATPPLVP